MNQRTQAVLNAALSINDEAAARIVAITNAEDYAPKPDEFYPPEVDASFQPEPTDILISGDREFVHFNYARVKKMIADGELPEAKVEDVRFRITDGSPRPEAASAEPTPIMGTPEFVARISGTPFVNPDAKTDAEYRAALKDDATPEPVKKAIREYFDKDQNPQSTAKRFIPTQRAVVAPQKMGMPIMGKMVPFVSDAPYKKPAGMSARQFKKSKKASFRAFRLVKSFLATQQSSDAS